MNRARHLGKGEEEAAALLDRVKLTARFNPCVVISQHQAALDELRARFHDAIPFFRHLEPSGELALKATAIYEELEQEHRSSSDSTTHLAPVVWVESSGVFAFDAWRQALDALNQQRELFRSEAPWTWILAGPPELQALLQDRAPDIRTGIVSRVELPDAPKPLIIPNAPLRWLHLSDLHFRESERWESRLTLKALLVHAGGLRDSGMRPDVVLITGDIAFSGKRSEYEQAELFLKSLAERLDLIPKERFFMVPGNHDVDLSRIRNADRALLAGLVQERDLEELLSDIDAMRLLGRRLEEFYAFTERLLGPARAFKPERPYRTDVLPIGGLDVAVLQLNSTWAFDRTDIHSDLWLGDKQLLDCIAEAQAAHVRIALMHHPTSSLHEIDRGRLDELIPEQVDFLLRGHLHQDRVTQLSTPDASMVELAAGCCYVEGTYPKSHMTAQLDWNSGEGEVHFYGYADRGTGFWGKNTLVYRQAPEGVWNFRLAPKLVVGDTSEGTTRATAADGALEARAQATLTARYRTAVSACFGTARFVGLAHQGPKPNVRILELYVPAKLERSDALPPQDQGAPAATPPELAPIYTQTLVKALAETAGAARSPGTSAPMAKRFAILGAPGSGKTTLCRYIAVALAGEAPGFEKEVRPETIPIVLPFQDYVRRFKQLPLSLLDFLVEQAKTQLSVHVTEAFLERALAEGRAVVLLDGLDVVGTATERVEMRDRVVAFLSQYPRASAVVTSRIAGYEQAPMPVGGPNGFDALSLAGFDDAQQEAFAEHWYRVQEPVDIQARQQGAAALITAFRVNPAVRELARNPLLATLIALVHRSEARLPGERALLFELCTAMLLETWPAVRKKQFEPIDEGLQRVYLEDLALGIQERRWSQEPSVHEARSTNASHHGAVITIDREDLIRELTRIALVHQGFAEDIVDRESRAATVACSPRTASAEQRYRVRREVEIWVDFLAQGSGILVEQQPGIYGFFHQSLLEYLAACALGRQGAPLVDLIVERFEAPAWQEVCLLAIGHRDRVTDSRFLTELFEQLSNKPIAGTSSTLSLRHDLTADPNQTPQNPSNEAVVGETPFPLEPSRTTWEFLLAAMAEEAAFNDEQRTRILSEVALSLLGRSVVDWQQILKLVQQLERSSRRHSRWIVAHFERELSSAKGDSLRAIVAMRMWAKHDTSASVESDERTIRLLASRQDRTAAAATLIDFWPGSKVGVWAAKTAELSGALQWSESAPYELAMTRCLRALSDPNVSPAVCAALTLNRIEATAHAAALSFAAVDALKDQSRPGGFGCPEVLQLGSSEAIVRARMLPRWIGRYPVRISDKGRYLAPGFTRSLARDFARFSFHDFAWYESSEHAREFVRYLARDFGRDFAQECTCEFSRHSTSEFLRFFDDDFTRVLADDFARCFARDFAHEFAPYSQVALTDVTLTAKAIIDDLPGRTTKTRPGVPLVRDTDTLRLLLKFAVPHLFVETYCALLQTVDRSYQDRCALLQHRVENLALLYAWPTLESNFSKDAPCQLALYLSLAWTQATTTWSWPNEVQRAMGLEPPDHWWPRAQWHVCRLLQNPSDAHHESALRAALEEGKQDAALSGIAERFEVAIGLAQ